MIRIAVAWMLLNCLTQAADINLNISSPLIETIKARMETRAPKVLGFLKQGLAGESSHGMLEAVDIKRLDLATEKSVLDTLAAENDDRQAFFREVAIAYHLASADEAGQVYAESRYAQADPAFWIQDSASGAWVRKKDFGGKK